MLPDRRKKRASATLGTVGGVAQVGDTPTNTHGQKEGVGGEGKEGGKRMAEITRSYSPTPNATWIAET